MNLINILTQGPLWSLTYLRLYWPWLIYSTISMNTRTLQPSDCWSTYFLYLANRLIQEYLPSTINIKYYAYLRKYPYIHTNLIGKKSMASKLSVFFTTTQNRTWILQAKIELQNTRQDLKLNEQKSISNIRLLMESKILNCLLTE